MEDTPSQTLSRTRGAEQLGVVTEDVQEVGAEQASHQRPGEHLREGLRVPGPVHPSGSNGEHGAGVDPQRGEDAEGVDGQAEEVEVRQLHVREQEREHVLVALITAPGAPCGGARARPGPAGTHRPISARAFLSVFESNMAMVIGPTPPGTGVM